MFHSAEAFERLLQTNLASVFHVGQAVARHMITRGRGWIINLASVDAEAASFVNGHILYVDGGISVSL